MLHSPLFFARSEASAGSGWVAVIGVIAVVRSVYVSTSSTPASSSLQAIPPDRACVPDAQAALIHERMLAGRAYARTNARHLLWRFFFEQPPWTSSRRRTALSTSSSTARRSKPGYATSAASSNPADPAAADQLRPLVIAGDAVPKRLITDK